MIFDDATRISSKLLFEEVLSDVGLMEAFERCPAGIKHHHAYAGGLLEHVVMLLRLADRVAFALS
jgi:3'-5' exoribonuclease